MRSRYLNRIEVDSWSLFVYTKKRYINGTADKWMELYFEWDDEKSESNFRKHGIRFEEAAFVFDDPLAVSVQDRIENGEERWQTIGMSGGCLLLLVAYTLRLEDYGAEIVRIISARRVDRKERRRYEHG